MKNKQFVLIFRGIPRAGKTTLAKKTFEFLKENGIVIVHYDEIFKIKKSFEKKGLRFSLFLNIIKKLLKEGYSLILDYSFTKKREIEKVVKFLEKFGINYRIYLLNPPFESVLERDNNFHEPKGKDTLLKFYRSLSKNIQPHSLIIDTQKLSEDMAFEVILNDIKEHDFI